MCFLQLALLALVVLLSPLSASSVIRTDSVESEWQNFKVKYNKSYSSAAKEQSRFEIFKENLLRAGELALENPEATFGVTRFSDLSPLEFKREYLGYRPKIGAAAAERMSHPMNHGHVHAHAHAAVGPKAAPNATIDWRTSGAISGVKDQGSCGSCWAFSAVEGVESAWFLKHGNLPLLSAQQVTSCDKADTGCDGGELQSAFAYIESVGLTTEAAYPYTSGSSGATGTCQKISSVAATITGFMYATPPCNDSCDNQDEYTLYNNVASTGPSSICVYAAPWQSYTGGIIGGGCSHDYNDQDHCVQLVGYNVKNQIPYWIVRNQWGTSWGEKGYIYVEYGKNLCGVADDATFAIAA